MSATCDLRSNQSIRTNLGKAERIGIGFISITLGFKR